MTAFSPDIGGPDKESCMHGFESNELWEKLLTSKQVRCALVSEELITVVVWTSLILLVTVDDGGNCDISVMIPIEVLFA